MKLNLIVAAIFAIVGFVLSVIAGLLADNTVETILWKAILCSGLCYLVGYAIGLFGQVIAQEHAATLARKVAEHDAREAAAKEEADREEAAKEAAAAATP